jgi:Electron transfer DM13
MEFGGVIERILAWIYPNRLLVGAMSVGVVVVLGLAGYRLGWQHVARRHPRASIAGLVVALAIGGPIGWVLGSPLFIRTELVEAAPDAGGGPVSSAPALISRSPAVAPSQGPASPGGASGGSASPAASVVPSKTPFVARTVLRGRFTGADDFHYGSGVARIVETAPGEFVLRFEDFSVRNGPDLFVYLSREADGYGAGAIELGRLKATDGSFNYRIPAATDVAKLKSAVVWCKAFSVQFAHAPLG